MKDTVMQRDLSALKSKVIELSSYIGSSKQINHLVLLKGLMGAGKTTFVKELGQQLGIEDNINSPTYIYLKEYQSAGIGEKKVKLFHFDLWRLNQPETLGSLGLRLGDLNAELNLICVEWPEKMQIDDELRNLESAGRLSVWTVQIEITDLKEQSREITISQTRL